MSAHIGPTLPGLPDARGITPVGRQPSPGPWRQAPGVSAHIWGPLPSGPPFPPGWRQPPDVSAHVGSLPPPVDARGATSAPPTCVNARVGLTAGWGSPGETAHIGPPPPRAESRRGPSPSRGSGRGMPLGAARVSDRLFGPAGPHPSACGPRRPCPRRKPRPACTRGAHLPATPGPRLPANWGSAASRRAHVRNRVPCIHAGVAFRHPPVPWGRLCLEPRPACTRGARLPTRARPRHPSSRQDSPAGWAPCRKPRVVCTCGTRFPAARETSSESSRYSILWPGHPAVSGSLRTLASPCQLGGGVSLLTPNDL